MKNLIAAIVLIFSGSLQAETITCGNQSQGIYEKIELKISPLEDEFGFIEGDGSLLRAELKFPHIRQVKTYTVFKTLRQNNIYYFDVSGQAMFSLKLGVYNPSREYRNVELATEQKSWFGTKLKNLTCLVDGDIHTPSLCQGLSKEKLDLKFLETLRSGSLDQIEQMVDCGVDVNSTDKYGCSPLLNLLDGACGYTQNNGKYPIRGAARGMDLEEVISLLIDNGAIIEAQDPVNSETPIIKLVKADRPFTIQTLIDYEVDINAKDKNGNTAIMHAAALGRKMLVKAVLAGNPDLDLRNNKNQTAYDIAKELKHNQILSLLAPVSKKIVFEGQADGSCTPNEVMLTLGESVKILLKASETKMFLFESPELQIELMAMKGSSDELVVKPTRAGIFQFTCGVHGEGGQTQGTIMVH